MGNKIILPYFTRLGDNLQFSTLPRRFSELGHKVYVSSRIKCSSAEIYGLVWGVNPFVLGLSDEEPNAGDGALIKYSNTTGNFIKNWEVGHGLAPKSERPELYYLPNNIKSVNDKILIDVSCSSLKDDYNADDLRKYITEHYDKAESVIAVFGDGISFPILFLDGYDVVFVKDIYYYCDLIYSCGLYVCLHSGGNSLASALQEHGKKDVECLLSKCPKLFSADASKLYMYDNIKYIWL